MDYKTFFAEIAEWINQVNQMALQHGMESKEFWDWVSASIGKIGSKYPNNKLVINQMAMLFEWLEDVYAEGKKQQ